MNIPGLWRESAASDLILYHPDPGRIYSQKMFQDTGCSWQRPVVANYTLTTRTAMFLVMLPLLALTTAVGLTDGLMARTRRRANAGRESAASTTAPSWAAVISSYLACLAVPSLTQPVWMLVPVAIGVGVLLKVQGGTLRSTRDQGS